MLPRIQPSAELGPEVTNARSSLLLEESRGLVSMLVLGMRAITGRKVKFQDVSSQEGPSELWNLLLFS